MRVRNTGPRTVEDAKAYLKKSHSTFRRKLKSATKIRGASARVRLYLDTLIGYRPLPGKHAKVNELLATDLKAQHELGRYMIDEAEKLHLACPHLEFYHVTLLVEEGVVFDREPYVPISPIKKKVHNSLSRKLGVDFVAVLECQGLTNWPQKAKGRTLLVHVHALLWFDRRKPPQGLINTEVGVEQEIKSPSWGSKFDVKPVKATRITPKRGVPAWWMAYLFKSPHAAKRRVMVPNPDSRSLFEDYKLASVRSEDGYRPEFALRIFELRSHLKLLELVVAGGAGAAMKRRCLTRLGFWQKHREYVRPPMKHFNLEAFRRQLKRRRRRTYHEFFVH